MSIILLPVITFVSVIVVGRIVTVVHDDLAKDKAPSSEYVSV